MECSLAEVTKTPGVNHSVDVSGVSLPGLLECMGNPFLMSQELARYIQRGTLDKTSVPVSSSLLAFLGSFMSKRSTARIVNLIQDWWQVTDLDNWVADILSDQGPPGLFCNRQTTTTREYFNTLLIESMEDILKKLRVKLSQGIRDAMAENERVTSVALEYHEKGEDRDSPPDMHGLYFQPWFMVMHNQVNLVDSM